MNFSIFLIISLVLPSCSTNTSEKANKVESIAFGYSFASIDSYGDSNSYFLFENNELLEIMSGSTDIDSIRISDFEIDLVNPLIDSLPISLIDTKSNKFGDLESPIDDAPWFVTIKMSDSNNVQIGSNNLPKEFSNYDKIVVNLLQRLYNRN